jgi:hypothetical protein
VFQLFGGNNMAAGKAYLKTTVPNGIGRLPVYTKDGLAYTLEPSGGEYWQEMLPVYKDGGGHFVNTPIDKASITGYATWFA